MPWLYVPIPNWLYYAKGRLDIFVMILGICFWLVRTLLKIENPPRARFTITPDQFMMELVERDGERTTIFCDHQKIAELRKNRYEEGLWIDVPGVTKETYLQDVDGNLIQAI